MPRITAADVRDMPLAERIQLVEDIWEDIAEDSAEVTLTDEQKRLIDERIAFVEAHPDQCIPWEEVRQRLRER